MNSIIKYIGILNIIRMIYKQWLRPALVEYVKSTENDLDDVIVDYVDLIIEFDPTIKQENPIF